MGILKLHQTITTERLHDALQRQMFGVDNPGFCIACGNEQEGCEPDAQGYTCEACGEPEVFGAQEIAMQFL